MTKEELLKRAKEVTEYYTIQGRENWLEVDYYASGCNMLRIEDLENNENMANFLVELINIMEKYNIGYSSVNGRWCNFKTKDINEDNAIRFGVSKLCYFFLTQEEMDEDLEIAKENAYQKMLNNRVKFLLPDNLKCKQSEEIKGEAVVCGDVDEGDCEIEYDKFHAEFTADIETLVELNHIETFTDENDIKNKICEKIANIIYNSTFYQISVKEDNVDLADKIQLKEIESCFTKNDCKNIKTYSVLIKDVLFEIEYYDDDTQEYSLNNKIIRLCEIVNDEAEINITNIENIEPKSNTEE